MNEYNPVLRGGQTRLNVTKLSSFDRHQVLYAFNDTTVPYDLDRCAHELFEAQVARTPDAIAIVHDDSAFTFAQLNARANQLAHALRRAGIGPESRVGVCMERNLEMAVALLGVFKAGGCYVPLDPAYSLARLREVVQNCAPLAVLAHDGTIGAHDEWLDAAGFPVFDVTLERYPFADEPVTNPSRNGISPKHLAAIVYTGGSPGSPTGVMIEHRALLNRLMWGQSACNLTADDAVLAKPVTFDVSIWELLASLLQGGKLVMARASERVDMAYFLAVIEREGVTVAHMAPSTLRLYLDEATDATCNTVQRVICAGEVLPLELAAEFITRFPRVELQQLYAAPEVPIEVMAWSSTSGRIGVRIPIGRPIANTRAYILNRQLDPVPIGADGELYIGGAHVARGYWNRPQLTAERFIESPYISGDRLYKTGDVARRLSDGNIEFVARTAIP